MDLVDSGFPVAIPASLAARNPEMISQGAEALVFVIRNPEQIAKYRPAKPWRLKELDDQLRKRRTVQEARVLQKLTESQIPVPKLVFADNKSGLLIMELIHGVSLKQATWDAQTAAATDGSTTPNTRIITGNHVFESVLDLYRQLGRSIARMHHLNIVHGDLTTSNAMVAPNADKSLGVVKIIDFGLSSQSASIEDKAVDLYVLERAIQSTHPLEAELLMHQTLMPEYVKTLQNMDASECEKVLARLELVRKRGRKRTQLG